MCKRKVLIPILIIIHLIMTACVYIVLPEGLDTKSSIVSKGWSGVVTGISQTEDGSLHIDLTIRNETGDWSTMTAVEDKPAILTTSDGKEHECETIFVGTGGHRLAPGFQMRGYTAGKKLEPVIQLIYVECAGVQDAKDAELSIDYVSFSGVMNYYQQEEGKDTGTMILDLNQVVTDISYPVFEPVEGLIQKQDVTYTAISENIISLLDVQRTVTGFDFTWGNFNPTEFALTIHIGNPPVIGDDGIIYGYYQIMDLATTPLTPAGGKVEWVTQAAVPSTVKGCYILLSVESKNMRNYLNYAIDITDK